MAKKKANNQDKTTQQHQDPTDHDTTPMEDPSEKLQNLKSLNSLLLKETFERRQQVESLQQSREALESELSRFAMEKKILDDELKQLREQTMGLELEKSVMGLFVETQIDDLRREEGEKVKSEIEVLKEKVNEVMGNLEKQRLLLDHVSGEGKKSEEKVSVLQMECEVLIEEKEKKDESIESLKIDKDLVERRLAESVRLNDDLKAKIEAIVSDKEGIEKERSAQMVLINELKKEVGELNENRCALLKEQEDLRIKVCELEKNLVEAKEKQEKMEMESNTLISEKNEMEKRLESLMGEKVSTMKSLEDAQKQLEVQKQKVEEILSEKNAIEEVKFKQESEIVELQKDVRELVDALSKLEKKFGEIAEKNKQLQSEATHYRDALNQITVERDDVKKGLAEEKKSGDNLRTKVVEVEKNTEETLKELEQMKRDHEKLIGEKKELQSLYEMLKGEKASAEKNLVEAQQGIDDMRGKVESMLANSELALAMLKNTGALVCPSKDENNGKQEEGVYEQNTKEETQPFAAQLEVIKNAFRSRETEVEDMKRQVETLQKTLAEAHKKRNFWTLVSSATTIFAAASFAYVAKGH
ncbi:hypothetical protein CK203_006943 [Vitis vinifera]|uniref:Uncharacterized protein n=1 Tax=Vitis vinifera TaxID=29760 RepID=A0A438KCZ0_VITVI|nr:hypothetical protein CK203_006943 [Vitis vinifera]